MKLFILLLTITAAKAAENYEGPEWAPIDWANVIYAYEQPGFWDDKPDLKPFVDTSFNRNRRIIGGQEAPPHAHPYQIAMLFTVVGPLLCGGSVINHRTILTAAHW